MENYAGFGEYADHEVGRLIDSLKEAGVYDNTVIIYIAGDNGMSAEGGLEGTLNEMAAFNGIPDTTANILAHLDEIGGPNSFPHIPVGWALAGDTPFQWTKQVASHYGGTRNGMVIVVARAHQGRGRHQDPMASRHRHHAHHPRDHKAAAA